jgi:hypothetical protein
MLLLMVFVVIVVVIKTKTENEILFEELQVLMETSISIELCSLLYVTGSSLLPNSHSL